MPARSIGKRRKDRAAAAGHTHTELLQAPPDGPAEGTLQVPQHPPGAPAVEATDGLDGPVDGLTLARERHGGFRLGPIFCGWLVAAALTLLLAGGLAGITTALGMWGGVTAGQARAEAGTVVPVSGVALLVVLLLAYYTGGYVAGRMTRFDGGRQGTGVWLWGLVVTIVVGVLAVLLGAQYDVVERSGLPEVPADARPSTLFGVVAVVVLLAGTLTAAVLGGKLGQRYHSRVDRLLVSGARP